MQQKNVLILSVVTVAALAVTALTLRDSGSAASSGAPARLFPELSTRINDIARVRLEKAGKSATLEKQGGQWKLADRGGYPAQFTKVKELAVRIADLEIEEAKTARKENHAQLAVEWPTSAAEGSEAGEAGLVTLTDASGKELASLVVGKSEWRGSKPKVFVRRAGEDQVYLCAPRGTLDVVPEAKSWIEPKFIELANDRVQTVAIEHTDGERVEIGRSAVNHTQFNVQNLPEGQKERYEGVANGVAQALGYGLQLEDVRPAGEVDFALEPLAKTTFRCVDGLELRLETAKFEDKVWVKVAASFTPPPEPAEPAPSEGAEPEAGAEGEPTPDAGEVEKEVEKPDIAKEAADLNQRLAPWAFEVGSYKTDVLARRMKDLLAEPSSAVSGDGGLGDALEGLELEGLGLGQEGDEAVEPGPVPDDEGVADPYPNDHATPGEPEPDEPDPE